MKNFIRYRNRNIKIWFKTRFCHTSIWSRNDRNSTDQIEQKRLCNHFMRRRRVKTALRAFTYVYRDIYDKQRSHDKNKNNTIKKVREKYMIWKLDNNNGVVLMNKLLFTMQWSNCFLTKLNFKSFKTIQL